MSPAAITIFCLLLGVAGTQGGPSRREPREAEDAHPRITYSKETIVKVGDEVKIDCAVEGVDLTGVDDFSVKWSKIDTEKPENSLPIAANDQIILFSNKYMIDHPADTYQYSLVIKEIKLEDTGIYRCTVNFDEKQKIDADVPVHIETAPFFTDDFTKTLTVTEGDAISIDCQPGGYPKPAVYWERLNQELPYYGGKFFKSNQFDLPLVSRDHKGHYVCYADNNVGDPANSHIILEVQYAPDVTVDKTQVFAVTDDEVLLECKVSANPEPDVAWFKDGEPILGGANYKMNKVELEEVTVMTLAVGKLTNDDFGTYSCRGVNVVGKTERTVEIRMKSPPLIVKQSRNEVLYDLERSNLRNALPVVIECEAEGDPAPEYRWNKNGAQLVWQADPRFDLEPGTGNLLISDPTRKDNGMYQCFAYNEMGTAVAEPVYLLNTTKIQFSNAGDSSDEYKFEAELGRPFKLSCPEPTGYPKVTMDWVKAVPLGDQIEMNFISDERTVVDPEGNLWFTHVTEADDSVKNNFQFICLGSNSFEPQDLSIASIIELTIKEPTDGAHNVAEESINVESFPMYTSPVNVTFRAQEENTLWCIYGGEPAPTVTWRRTDGSEFDDARFVTRNFGRTLVFKDTQVIDSGEYECTASNNVGEAKTWAMNVTVEQVPTFTSNLTSQTVQEGATVTFTCHTEATGEVTYTWTLNGRVIKPNGNSRRTVSGPKLVIVDVSIADIGNYACNASSDIGYAYGQAILNVIPGVRPVGGVGTAQCSEMDELVVKVATMQETIDVMKQLLMESHELTKHTHEKLCQLEESLLTKKETVNTNIKDSQPQEQQEQEQQQQQQEEQQHQQKQQQQQQQQQPQQTQQQEEEEEITTEAIFRF